MTRQRSRRSAVTVAVTGAVALVASMAPSASAAKPDTTGKPLTAMTRNIYLGGDIMRPIVAVEGKTGQAALIALGTANHALRQVVDETDFPTRSKLLAREIATTRPDVVGLQEVALWRHGPMELDKLGVSNATVVDYDFLSILTADLAAAGAAYRVANVQTQADVEAPAFTLGATGITDASDQRLTMRDVLLVRVDPGLTVLASGGANYATRLPVDVAGIPLAFVRGYNWADLRVGSAKVRVVNTHLESASSDVALGQARELVAGPANTRDNLVVTCDCNSDPLDHSVKPEDPYGTPHSGPYDYMVAAGLHDLWLRWAPASAGWTSGLSEGVKDTTTAGFDHRIDLILGHNATGGPLTPDRGEVTGNELADRDPGSGLWPSDHAGVVLRLRGLS